MFSLFVTVLLLECVCLPSELAGKIQTRYMNESALVHSADEVFAIGRRLVTILDSLHE